jgi:hypothetical protein
VLLQPSIQQHRRRFQARIGETQMPFFAVFAAKESIECEYRQVPGYAIVEVPDTNPSYAEKSDLPKEYEACQNLGLQVNYEENGQFGETYTDILLEFPKQATFHPTK